MTSGPGAVRGWGYRVLGARLDYLLHFRPAEWPIMAAHTALGYVLAVGIAGVAMGASAGAAVCGLVLWVVCLNGGTLAINSAFDRDEGDIAYLRRPPPPPRRLFAVGIGAMLLGLILAAIALPIGYVGAYAVCLVLSVLYSVPPVRLKAVAGADWLINMWGFGTLTPYAGWAATGRNVDFTHGLILLAFCPLFGALYPLTQLYQMDEDRSRGDATLAIRLGLARSLDVAIGAAALAFMLFGWAASRSGWTSGGAWRWVTLGTAALAWIAVLLPWRLRAPMMSGARHQRGMYLALVAWAVTDLGVGLAWGV